MDLQFHGANCLTITTKQTRLVIDDNLSELGAKPVAKPGDVVLLTSPEFPAPSDAKLVIDQPGEYEVAGVSVIGIRARAHMDAAELKTATIYKIMIDDINLLVTGHIYPELTESQLEAIGRIDVMFVPVGGNGYTLDSIGALKLIKDIEPKLVIPTHFADDKLNFPVPQQGLEDALKGLAMEVKETTAKLRLKTVDLTDSTQLIVLERS